MLLRLVTHLGDTMDNGKEAPIPVAFSLFYLMDEQSSQSLFDIAPLDSALAISDYWVMSQQ